MRDSSDPPPTHARFSTIRRQLLWSYGVLILVILLMAAAFGGMFLDYYGRVDELLSLNAATATISIKLEDTHQLLENTINYEDPSFIRPYRERRADLEAYIKEYDSLALKTAELLNDWDAYYQFLEIQEIVLIYAIESDILLDLFGEGVKRFELYDKLYSLRDLNYRIYELQSALLVRQNNYLRRFYTEYSPVMRRRMVTLFGVLMVFVVFSVIWTLRQAREVSDPLHQLVLMNMELADGNFAAVHPLRVRNEEIATLGEAFVFMAGKLSESMENEKKALMMESSLRQARLEILQAQVNPHFLFNALNTVRSLSQLENAPRTEGIIDALAAFLRYGLDKSDSPVALSDEFAMAEHYLRIQKMRFGNRLDYSITLEPDASSTAIPGLLLQPLVENAIVHGVEPRKEGGCITISGRASSGRTTIEITDDGAGMHPGQAEAIHSGLTAEGASSDGHVGIRNSWRRLMLTDPEAEMAFHPAPGGRGCEVRISLSSAGKAPHPSGSPPG